MFRARPPAAGGFCFYCFCSRPALIPSEVVCDQITKLRV